MWWEARQCFRPKRRALFHCITNGVEADLAGRTNATLVLTNVTGSSAGNYFVVVTNAEGSVTSAVARLTVILPPVILSQPANQTVEQDENVTFAVTSGGSDPLSYQWQFNETVLSGKSDPTLVLTNLQFTNAGGYSVVITNMAGAVTSRVAMLTVEARSFTKITTGSIVNDGGYSFGCAWGDYNNDGWIDLFVANDSNRSGGVNSFLYQNNGNGTFSKIANNAVVMDGGSSLGCSWADYDNDGQLDLFVVNSFEQTSRLYHNNGNGTFATITSGALVTESLTPHAGVWGDFDNDGFIDLFLANFRIRGSPSPSRPNLLFRNSRDGTFTRMTLGTKTTSAEASWNAAWGDFDNDGDLDLFVPNGGRLHEPE